MMKPDENLLKKYAQVMVQYALNNGDGINKGDTVFLVGQECTKDLFMAIAKEIYAAGGNVITNYLPNNTRDNSLSRFLLENGTDEQISFFAKPYWQGIVDATDHILFIMSEPDIHYFRRTTIIEDQHDEQCKSALYEDARIERAGRQTVLVALPCTEHNPWLMKPG